MDPSQGTSTLTPEQSAKYLKEFELSEVVESYNGLIDRCFSICVTNFRSSKPTQAEESCIFNCAYKFIQTKQATEFAFMKQLQEQMQENHSGSLKQ